MSLELFLNEATASKPQALPVNVFASIDDVEDMSNYVVSAETEIIRLSNALDEAEALEDRLVAMDAALGNAIETEEFGGVSATLMRFDVAMESYLPLKADFEMPSFESVEEDPKKEAEGGKKGVMGSIKNVGKVIADIVKKLAASLGAWLKQTFTMAGRLEKGVATLEKAVKEAKGTPKEKEISVGGIKNLCIGAELADVSGTIAQYKGMLQASKTMESLLKEQKKLVGKESSTDSEKEKVSELWRQVIDEVTLRGKPLSAGDAKQLGVEEGTLAGTPLPGNMVTVINGSTEKRFAKLVKDTRITADAPKKVEALELKDIEVRIAAAKDSLAMMNEINAQAEVVTGIIKAIGKEGKDLSKDSLEMLRRGSRFVQGANMASSKNALQFANANAQYAKASLKNLEEK